jgi:hypothetical protein
MRGRACRVASNVGCYETPIPKVSLDGFDDQPNACIDDGRPILKRGDFPYLRGTVRRGRCRFAAMAQRLEAIKIVQPALESFYGGFTDEQEARFNQLGAPQS